jgi:hypothetical protein
MFENKKVLYGLIAALIVSPFVISAYVLPGHKTVILTSKEWVCASSDTLGIEARCIAYTYVKGPKLTLNE